MPVTDITMNSSIRKYNVIFCNNHDFISKLNEMPNRIFIIDENVWKYHSKGSLNKLKKKDIILLKTSEEKKNLETVQKLYGKLTLYAAKKNINIVSIGGGITQDITGFLASTLYRGVNWIFVPTTLLAQADSCIGSKTSLNYKNFKNLVGTFYPPTDIYIYTPFLATEDKLSYFSGLGEVVKLHIMDGQKSVEHLVGNLQSIINGELEILQKTIYKCLLIKKSFIEGDEFDTGRRNLLNYGHCFGHALESASNFTIPHGQAVVLGIILANIISKSRGILTPTKERYFLDKILLPTLSLEKDLLVLDKKKIIEAMKQDKKRIGMGLALVLINDLYEMTKINDLSEKEADVAINLLNELLEFLHRQKVS